MRIWRAGSLVALLAALWLPAPRRAQAQPVPKPAHGKKKAKKGYDYDQSEYKAYHALNSQSHYRFDKDANPVDDAPAKKVARSRHKKKSGAGAAASPVPGANTELAHAHFASSVANPNAPPAAPAAGAPRSEGQPSGSAPVIGGSCQGDTCSQPPGGQ